MKRIAIGLLTGIFLLTACRQGTHLTPPTPVSIISHTATFAPTSFATATILPAPSNTATTTPVLDAIRSTPPTIMLHRPNENFDSISFLKDLIAILKQNNIKVVTYRDIYNNPAITATEKGRLFIITIDDIYLPYPIHKDFLEMIKLLREAGYPAVLGVVTETDYPDPQNIALLKELTASGWEIASHTDKHANLGKLEKASEKLVYKEVMTSLDKIEKTIGMRPITLILPDGQMVNDVHVLYGMNLYWVVGINSGIIYDSNDEIRYVGRESPSKTAEQTYQNMRDRFGF